MPQRVLSAQRRHEKIRLALRPFFSLIAHALMRVEVGGTENIPPRGPLLIAFNHIGHLDPFLVYLTMPQPPEIIGLAEAWHIPVIGFLVRLYGGIPVQRDQVDRAVVEAALAILHSNHMLALAPEARISPTGQLSEGRTGAAYLACKAGAPVLPAAVTGTERLGRELKRWRRPRVSITYGAPMSSAPLPSNAVERKRVLREETDQIMRAIAAMLPEEYRGVYRVTSDG